jgi:regulation of enolase protein 1 (concanavalin A-like superfamily)
LGQGRQDQAAALLQQVLICVAIDRGRSTLFLEYAYFLGAVLAGLWQALDDEAAFRAACRVLEQDQSTIRQWILEPAEPGTPGDALLQEDLFDGLLPQWTWHDPCSDCGYTVGHGLEIRAANGRRLWGINKSAPRLLQTTSGDWIAQCASVPATADRPAIGGLLLWADVQNYLYLSRGLYDAESVELMGCVDNSDIFVGLGRLRANAAGRVTLRLERQGETVTATCSADGQAWFGVGRIAFSVQDSVQVGLHASSTFELLNCHEIQPEGSAIRFESFRLWEKGAPTARSA